MKKPIDLNTDTVKVVLKGVRYQKPKLVKTFDRLLKLSREKKCVINTRQNQARHMPAAIVVHYPAIVLHQMLKNGVLAEYRAKPRTASKKALPRRKVGKASKHSTL